MGSKNDVSNRFIEAYEQLLNDGLVPDKKTFAANIGVSPSMITEIHKGRSSVGTTAIQNIVLSYGVSAEWLLTGEGDMLKSDKPDNAVEVVPIHQSHGTEKKEESQEIYLYDFKAAAGLKYLFDNSKQNIIDTIRIPNQPKCDGAIRIYGDSMEPRLTTGDIILYKRAPVELQNIIYGEMYLLSYNVDGDDYVVVKYIRKSERGEPYITLASENPEHADRDIDFRCVNALALIKATLRIRVNSMA